MAQQEQLARENIDKLLTATGWHCRCRIPTKPTSTRPWCGHPRIPPEAGSRLCRLPPRWPGRGGDRGEERGGTLTGVETQAARCTKGLPYGLPRWSKPLPFLYQSAGVETRFTNGLDPQPRSRPVFAFHRETAAWLELAQEQKAAEPSVPYGTGKTFLEKLHLMPQLYREGLWPAQFKAIDNLDKECLAH